MKERFFSKKIIAAILIFTVAISSVFITTTADSTAANGTYTYEDLTYTVLNGEVTVTDCDTYAAGAITVPEFLNGCAVTKIGNAAFYGCNLLTSVKISDTVTSIGEFAFYGCNSLVSVILPETLRKIGDFSFFECENLDKIYYGGTETQWTNITVGNENSYLENSEVKFRFVFCDVDYDGLVSATDLTLIKKAVFGSIVINLNHPGAYDTNCDGAFNILDLVKIKKTLLNIEENGDGSLNDNTSSSSKPNDSTSSDSNTSENTSSGNTVSGLDFRGRTFRKTIIGAIPAATMRRKAAFEKKYNCKLELVSLQWEQFNSQCATAVAAGTPYDICGTQSYFWPEAGVKGLYEPLNDYISTDDLYNAKTGVGIDLEKSNYFALNGKIYAVSNHHGNCADTINVMFYNKVKFDEAYGDPDYPLTLYKQGKWTWDALVKLAKEVNDEASDTYLVGRDLNVGYFTSMNGWSGVKIVNGKFVENTSDSKYLEALKYWQENIVKTNLRGPGGSPSDNFSALLNGTQWMHVQGYQYGTYYMYDGICNSTAFEKNFKNLGIVPLPTGPSNTEGLYNSAGPQGKAAGKGSSDPRVVIAWTKFDLEFEDPVAEDDPTLYSEETYDMIWKLFDKLVYATPNFKTYAQSASSFYNNITNEANKANGNIVKAITANAKNIQAVIDECMGY